MGIICYLVVSPDTIERIAGFLGLAALLYLSIITKCLTIFNKNK